MAIVSGGALNARRTPPHFIYLTGCDGTGKSTQAALLLNQLQFNGVKTRHVWMRFPFFFSIPFLVYARLRGYSWREQSDGVTHGYWDFRGSWLMEKVYPWVLLVDTTLASTWKIYLPLLLGHSLVCERYVLDMLADFVRATGSDQVLRSPVGRLFLKLIPANNIIVFMDLDANLIRQRRPDLAYDKALERKLGIYHNMAAELGLPLISSKEPVDVVHNKLLGWMYEDQPARE